ncbi:MAG: DUF1566 domain-containing protein [Sphaerochaetaceae bacterium]|nr:DUF1566 domain-containing protein [Sphaerochaetaceae bacterium]
MKRRTPVLILAVSCLIFLFSGCAGFMMEVDRTLDDLLSQSESLDGTDEQGPQESQDDQQDTVAYQLGDQGPAGGWVFYDKGVYSDGWRYLEMAPYGWYGGARDPSVQWGAKGYEVVPAATETAAGSGAENTVRIVEFHDKLIEQYPERGIYGFNPQAYGETNDGSVAALLCEFATINGYEDWYLPAKDELTLMRKLQKEYNIGDIEMAKYWSSTEADADKALAINFYVNVITPTSKDSSYQIRPVRMF